MQLFLDCDGVLADFDKFFEDNYNMNAREYEKLHGASNFWKEIRNFPGGFFRQLPLMPDAIQLVEAVNHLNPIILTGMPLGDDWAKIQKEAWRDEHLPHLPMICCQSKYKYTKMVADKHNIIIDDWAKHKHVWEENGGTFILHTNTEDSLQQLCDLGHI